MNAREITDNVWILEASTNERVGIINYNINGDKYTIISAESTLHVNSFSELEEIFNEKIIIKEKEISTKLSEISGYPIQHETPLNIREENSIIKYDYKSKTYYAGYWVTPRGNNQQNWYTRVGISSDIYNSYIEKNITPLGPFKEKMEAQFAVKQQEKGA